MFLGPKNRFAAPVGPLRHVPRPRLTDVLDATTAPLTLLAAGPGAGKTVQLSEWVRSYPGPTAWISLVGAEDDARRFWPQFLDAVRSVGLPAHDLRFFRLGLDGCGGQLDATRPSTGNAPAVVVLDEAPLVAKPEVVDGLDAAVRGCRRRLRLVLAARSDPLLPLGEYRASARERPRSRLPSGSW